MKDDRRFAHSLFDSKIIRFYAFFKGVISLTTGKMASDLLRAMERTVNIFFIIYRYLKQRIIV
jgi:hypothetical protein